MKRYDSAEIIGKVELTPEGYIRAKAVVTRAGTFRYKNKDGSVRVELRRTDEVFRDETLESLKMIPITIGHPEEFVNAKNAKALAKGFTGETVEQRGDECLVSILVTHDDAIRAIQNGRRELSLGYDVAIDPTPGTYKGERYDSEQTEIVYNHLAIVDRARAGSRACLRFDADDAYRVDESEQLERGKTMKIEINGVFVEVDDAVGSAYLAQAKRADDAETKADAANTEKEKAEAAADDAKAKAEAAEKRADSMDAVDAIVEKRVRLRTIAAKVMDADDLAKLNVKDERAQMIAIIAKRNDGFTGEGKSDEYLAARIDLIDEEKPAKQEPAKQAGQFRKDGDDEQRHDAADMAAAYNRQFTQYNHKTEQK